MVTTRFFIVRRIPLPNSATSWCVKLDLYSRKPLELGRVSNVLHFLYKLI